MAETRLLDEGKLLLDDYSLFYSRGTDHQYGVGILLNKEASKSVMGCWCISKKNMLNKLKGSPFNVSILKTYVPTLEHEAMDVAIYYEEIEKALKMVKSDEMLIVMGDFNSISTPHWQI